MDDKALREWLTANVIVPNPESVNGGNVSADSCRDTGEGDGAFSYPATSAPVEGGHDAAEGCGVVITTSRG
jgi:hypothetical protein